MRPVSILASVLATTIVATAGAAVAQSVNAGERAATSEAPFKVTAVAAFDTPWAMALLPGGGALVTEKPGKLFVVDEQGRKTEVGNVPAVLAAGQNGLLDVATAPNFDASRQIYLSYVEPGDGGTLVLLRASLAITDVGASLEQRTEIWRQTPSGGGGQPGGIIAFDPAGEHLFLSVGDRMRPESAQDPDQARGKVLRLNLDGSIPSDNPMAASGGVRGQTWSTGHRNPYGLAFATNGDLWLHEMGPRGGDELNLIEAGRNYGWAEVSNGDNYNGTPIPRHDTRPEFAPPAVYWTPVIAPAGLAFYQGEMFPEWQGSAFIGGLRAQALVRVAVEGETAGEVDRWSMNARIRDVAVAADGAVWMIEDASPGRLLRLTPADD